MTAKFVKDLKGFTGQAKLYKVDPPVEYDDGKKADHVVVSATVAMFSGPETYIFPADKDGEIVSWSEIKGSYRGGLDHQSAIDGLCDE